MADLTEIEPKTEGEGAVDARTFNLTWWDGSTVDLHLTDALVVFKKGTFCGDSPRSNH